MSPRLAIDLGTSELKLIEAKGNRLIKHAELLLPDGAIVDGAPTPLLTAALRAAIEEGAFSARVVRLAISEAGSAFRDFRLPRIPASELSDAVAFEGRRLIPMEAEDVYFAWHATRDSDGYAIYLVATHRAMIDGVVAAVSAAGLSIEHIDLKPLALARGMGLANGLLLEWGAQEATLVLVTSSRPRFFRSFQLDSPADDYQAQLDELSLSVNALVKFMRGAAPDVTIGPGTPMALAGRFAFAADTTREAADRFPFTIVQPAARLKAPLGFPWQAHFTGIGLLLQERWVERLTPSQGGDNRVAA